MKFFVRGHTVKERLCREQFGLADEIVQLSRLDEVTIHRWPSWATIRIVERGQADAVPAKRRGIGIHVPQNPSE